MLQISCQTRGKLPNPKRHHFFPQENLITYATGFTLEFIKKKSEISRIRFESNMAITSSRLEKKNPSNMVFFLWRGGRGENQFFGSNVAKPLKKNVAMKVKKKRWGVWAEGINAVVGNFLRERRKVFFKEESNIKSLARLFSFERKTDWQKDSNYKKKCRFYKDKTIKFLRLNVIILMVLVFEKNLYPVFYIFPRGKIYVE